VRVIVASVTLVALAGCSSSTPRVTSPTPGQYNDGPALREQSPDGNWSVAYSRRNGYGNLDVTHRTSHRRYRMYHSNDGCCSEIAWLPPHDLVFDDDYKVQLLDPATRRVATIAHFSAFVISPDGHWLAGYADSGGHAAETVGVVDSRGGGCRTVPHAPDQDDTVGAFTADGKAIDIIRRRFDTKTGETTRAAHVVRISLTDLRPGSC